MDAENDLVAQGNLIHPNYLQYQSIGDTDINWVASDGDPSSVAGATISGNANFDGTDEGVWLTPATNGTTGYLYWQKDYDYTKNIIMSATTRAGGGDGADGITFFLGASDTVSHDGEGHGSISVYLDEYDGDTISVYKNDEVLQGPACSALKTLDDNTYNFWEIVYEYKDTDNIFVHVLMNKRYVSRVNVAPWTPGGNYIGISAWCGGQNNVHSVKSFQVKSARGWIALTQ